MTAQRLAAVLVLWAAAALSGASARAGDLAPERGWRIPMDGRVREAPAADGSLRVAVDAPEARSSALLVVVEATPAAGHDAIPVMLAGVPAGGGAATVLERRALRPAPKGQPRKSQLAHLTVPAGRFRAFELALGGSGGAAPRLGRVRLFKLDERGRNDYWLFLGASLEAGAIDPDLQAKEITARHAEADPYVANEAVSGSTAGALRKGLAAILAEHPHARYVPIHTGGNDVTLGRPFPGAADRLRGDIGAIVRAVREAGKVPILARLSFRAYRPKDGKPGVPPEENGALPYVTQVFDPIIASGCPEFFDAAAGRGRVDLYGWFRDHPGELGADGIHLGPKGSASLRRIWAESAGDVIYPRRVR